MKVAVLGSGNGGCAAAFDFARAGHDVWLFDFPEFPRNIAAIARQQGIFAEGELQGFAPVRHAGHSIGPAVAGAELVLVVGPAYSTAPFAEACRPHVEPGQTVVVCPGSCAGAIVFKNALGLDLADDRFLIADTAALPYVVELAEKGWLRACKDNVALRAGLGFAKGYLTFLPTAKAQNRAFTPADEAIAMLEGR